MDWPGYCGWEATLVYQEEINILRKKWSIPYTSPGNDITFVYDDDIICAEKGKEKKGRRRIVRTKK